MPSINPNAVHPDDIDTPEDAVYVPFDQGHEHGYIGTRSDTTPREAYTVAGVTSKGRNPGPTSGVPESRKAASAKKAKAPAEK